MKTLLAGAALAALVAGPSYAATTFYGPTPYLSQADAPFQPGDFDVFHLEDLEDGAVNTPGLSITSPHCITNTSCFIATGNIDSVGNGGNANLGHSVFSNGMNVRFNGATLGAFPTFAGLVWTDGTDPISVTFFDGAGVAFGTLTGSHADGNFLGGTAEDRFYGAFNTGGISRIFITNGGGVSLEADHIQYGLRLTAVPEPATWAMMILGFAALGGQLRRRRAQPVAA